MNLGKIITISRNRGPEKKDDKHDEKEGKRDDDYNMKYD